MFASSRRSRARTTYTYSTSSRGSRLRPSVRVTPPMRTKPTLGQRIRAAFARPTASRRPRKAMRNETLVRRGHRTSRMPTRSKPSLSTRIRRLFSVPISPNARRGNRAGRVTSVRRIRV